MARALRPPGRLVDIGGHRLHLIEQGPQHGGPSVVFDAALAGSSLSWTRVLPLVAPFARVYAYDRAGLGWSDAGPLPRTAGRSAEELHALLAAARVPAPFVLVGHSYGGLIARIFAARYAGEMAGLVLVDPAQPADWLKPSPYEQARVDRGVRLCVPGALAARVGVARLVSSLVSVGALAPAWTIVRLFTRGTITRLDDGLLGPMFKLPVADRRPLRYFWTQARFFEALGSHIATISVSAAETLAAGAGGYGDLPLVTISSTNPGDYRIAQQEAFARSSTRGRHLIATNSSHWIPLDQPELVSAAIRSVVERSLEPA
jgi:pimeloyl-ACP methyl ester carboxylesterase